jgi:DNA-methyltransferase (dcm)
MSNKYKVIDLFSGAGGLSMAFQNTGAEIVWAYENNKFAGSLYGENISNVHVEESIDNINIQEIPDCDILLGQCLNQSFSFSYNCKGVETKRKDQLSDIFSIIKVKKPKVFLIDSIKALKFYDNGRIINLLIEELRNEGYYIKYSVLNSIEYGNIPHNKERIYIVGFRNREVFLEFEFPAIIELTKKVNNILKLKDEKQKKYYYNKGWKISGEFNIDKIIQEKFYQIMYKTKLNDNSLREYQYCPSLNMRFLPVIRDNYGVRRLTPSECFAFQGYFNIKIPQGINDKWLYIYACQCSSVSVVERIAENIINVLDNSTVQKRCKNVLNNVEEVKANDVITLENDSKIREEFLDLEVENDIEPNEDSLSGVLRLVEQSVDKKVKGNALEKLMYLFFKQVDGFHVNTNVRTKTEEIDISIRNESKSEFWNKESILFLGECKNWTEKCGKNELVVFRAKIENRRDRVKLGFFISWNGFKETYKFEDLRGTKEDILIIPITGQQIKECITENESNVDEFLKTLYLKAINI